MMSMIGPVQSHYHEAVQGVTTRGVMSANHSQASQACDLTERGKLLQYFSDDAVNERLFNHDHISF